MATTGSPAAAQETSAPASSPVGKRAEGRIAAEKEQAVLAKLWQLYSTAVAPLEKKSFYKHFHAPPITEEEFEARPQVLLVGQYSTGKTSMVKWLTGVDSPHFDVRPQPSTDKFMAVVHGPEERLIHGNAATCLPQLPYQGLATFGSSFLDNFQALVMPSEILRDLTFIDTPGVLSGCKQRIGRNYDFASVCRWLAARADLILMTFDAHKLDISDEFQEVMEVLRPHADKVRCVLNKADQIDSTNLVRVYGALLWNVGKVLRTPEIAKVFTSSFWTEPYRYEAHKQLFDEDKEAVIKELKALPRTALLRKMNDFVARVRKVKAHMCVVTHIRQQLPWHLSMLGNETRVRRWVEERLPQFFEDAMRLRALSPGDMPDFKAFRDRLESFEGIAELPTWDARDVTRLEDVIEHDVPQLMSEIGGVSTVSLRCTPAATSSSSRGFFGFGRKRPRTDD
mmetsp:Transcript_20333/g.36973  ORF Transcript_20333/g.36973 Transcript_20333/m.36973 type:complete len:453 (+) Transcript_20333:61-1419(+)